MDKELMSGKTVMYVHGFGSSAQSGTVKLLREALPQANVVAYDLPIHPEEAVALLKEKCDEHKPDLIIGTSMGGMYAEQLYGHYRILINPAFNIADTMREHGLTGKQTFFNKRQDGVQEFYVDKPLIKEYAKVSEQCFSDMSSEEQRLVYGLFGDEDQLVHTFDIFRQHYKNGISFHGEHRMTDHSFTHAVIPVIRWIDDIQKKRERPVIYISFDAMRDSYGKPMSCLQKAYQMLIKHYEVYITASAPYNDADAYKDIETWALQYINVPAYNHIIYCNQKHLLLGDFLISLEHESDFMGTHIELGSDDFKTWEEIITYFERLGGQ